MYRPRATKNEMTFERADRMEANKSKRLIEFFAACQERLFYYGKEDEAFYFEMLKEYVKDCEEFMATYEERQRTESK